MNAEVVKDKQPSKETTKSSVEEFDFERWAKQVRPLLLASLTKRGSRI